jgi:hypothetical protein
MGWDVISKNRLARISTAKIMSNVNDDYRIIIINFIKVKVMMMMMMMITTTTMMTILLLQ